MAGFRNDIMYATNGDFTTANAVTGSAANGLNTDGQMWIGRTATNAGGTHISVGTLTSPDMSVTIGYSAPNITLQASGGGAPSSFTPWIVGQPGDVYANYTDLQTAITAAQGAGASASSPINLYLKAGTYGSSTLYNMPDGVNLVGLCLNNGGVVGYANAVDTDYPVVISGYLVSGPGANNRYSALRIESNAGSGIGTEGKIWVENCSFLNNGSQSLVVDGTGEIFAENSLIRGCQIFGSGKIYMNNCTVLNTNDRNQILSGVGTYYLSNCSVGKAGTTGGEIASNFSTTINATDSYFNECIIITQSTLNLTDCTIIGGISALDNGTASTINYVNCNDGTNAISNFPRFEESIAVTTISGSAVIIDSSTGQLGVNGISTNTGQPAFFATNSTPAANVTGDGTTYNLVFDTIVHQNGTNFDGTTGVFTVPESGFYQFSFNCQLSGIIAQNSVYPSILAGGSQYVGDLINPATTSSGEFLGMSMSQGIYLLAAATVQFQITAGGSTLTVDVDGLFGRNSYCSAYLVC